MRPIGTVGLLLVAFSLSLAALPAHAHVSDHHAQAHLEKRQCPSIVEHKVCDPESAVSVVEHKTCDIETMPAPISAELMVLQSEELLWSIPLVAYRDVKPDKLDEAIDQYELTTIAKLPSSACSSSAPRHVLNC